MKRIFESGAAGSPPSAPASPSVGYPTSGNPSTATPATKPGPYWFHQVTEEILAVITAAGVVPNEATLTQLATAIQSGKLISATAGGSADALAASFLPSVTSLVNGMSVLVRAGSANVTTTPNFTPNSGVITAKIIVKGANAALAIGDIAGAGHWIALQYDSTLDRWVLLNPATGVIAASTAGKVAQIVSFQTGAVATGAAGIPNDDTIPQITEGDQFMSLAITPQSSTSKLEIDITLFAAVPIANPFIAALFQDSTANALASARSTFVLADNGIHLTFKHVMTAGTTSSTTFKVRAGQSTGAAGVITFNGGAGARSLGGSMASRITIKEILQ